MAGRGFGGEEKAEGLSEIFAVFLALGDVEPAGLDLGFVGCAIHTDYLGHVFVRHVMICLLAEKVWIHSVTSCVITVLLITRLVYQQCGDLSMGITEKIIILLTETVDTMVILGYYSAEVSEMTFGEKLKEARQNAKMSQEELSIKLNVSRSAVA